MSGKSDKNFHEEEGEDKKCPPNRHTPFVPEATPFVPEAERVNVEEEERRRGAEIKQALDDIGAEIKQASDDFEAKMEEGVFCEEWEDINKATDGYVPGPDPDELGVSNEARQASFGSSGGERAVPSLRGTDASTGAEAVDSRAHPPNNAQRRTCTLPPTRPGAERVPGPDYEGLDEDEDQMTLVSSEETTTPFVPEATPFVPEAEPVNAEEEERRRGAEIKQALDDILRTTPVAEVVPDNTGRRQKLLGAFVFVVILIAIVVGAVLGSRTDKEKTMSPSDYDALLSNVSSDGGEALRNSSTPQYDAFNWMVTNKAAYSDERIIQRYALATIFYSTNGNDWDDKPGWLSNFEECSWYGVNCTTSGTVSVSELDLRGPYNDHSVYEGNNLAGSLPPEIGLLSALAWLYLESNKLTGFIPSDIGMLSNLVNLDLGSNALEGTIPSEVWQLSKLTSLALYSNTLTGTTPSEIGVLSNLEELLLWKNTLEGTIPSEVGQLMNLTSLYLSNNTLSGMIPPEIGMLSNLVNLDLSYNRLEDTVPSEVLQLTKLTNLDLESSKLTGMIPSKIGMLSDSLTWLWLGSNELEGTMPSEVGQLTKLTWLDLESNKLTGFIPSEIMMLSNLVNLDLGSNALEGTIPSEVWQLSKLNWLDLSDNKFSGTIPSEINSLVSLVELYLYGNNFTGNYTCPDSIIFCYISCEASYDEYTDACRSL